MAHEITIRKLGPDDLEMLIAMPLGLFDNPVRPDAARAFLSAPDCVMLMAFDDGRPVGMASGTVLRHPDKAPAMFVNEVGVRNDWQRRGIGKALTQGLIDLARDMGCDEGVWLGTEPDNAPALALYRSLGGHEVTAVLFGWDDAL